MVVATGIERVEQVCVGCGYGAMLPRTQKPPCPMCQSTNWRAGRRRPHD